jgi:hypothetical protein
MFRVISAPIVRSTIKTVDAIIGRVHVSLWCGLNPLKDVQGRESISLCHGQIRTPRSPNLAVTSFNGFKPHHVSVWFKSVEGCPRSGVYFTMSRPN